MARRIVSRLFLSLVILKVACSGSYPPVIRQSKNSTALAVPFTFASGRKFSAHLVGLFVSSSELPIFHEVIKPTLEIAVEEAERRFPQIEFKITVRNGSNTCESNIAGAYAAEEFYTKKVDVFIGPACSLALDSVARMASYWNVPIMTAGGIGAEFANKKLYNTLTRLSFSLGMLLG